MATRLTPIKNAQYSHIRFMFNIANLDGEPSLCEWALRDDVEVSPMRTRTVRGDNEVHPRLAEGYELGCASVRNPPTLYPVGAS